MMIKCPSCGLELSAHQFRSDVDGEVGPPSSVRDPNAAIVEGAVFCPQLKCNGLVRVIKGEAKV